jgi:hypothetical protein
MQTILDDLAARRAFPNNLLHDRASGKYDDRWWPSGRSDGTFTR